MEVGIILEDENALLQRGSRGESILRSHLLPLAEIVLSVLLQIVADLKGKSTESQKYL